MKVVNERNVIKVVHTISRKNIKLKDERVGDSVIFISL
jgi:hypothetical protein